MPGSFNSSQINACVVGIGVLGPRFIVSSERLGLHKMLPPRGFKPGTSRMLQLPCCKTNVCHVSIMVLYHFAKYKVCSTKTKYSSYRHYLILWTSTFAVNHVYWFDTANGALLQRGTQTTNNFEATVGEMD